MSDNPKTIKTPKGPIDFKMIVKPVDMVGEKEFSIYHVRIYQNLSLLADPKKDVADIYTIWRYNRKYKSGQVKESSCIGLMSGSLDAMYYHINDKEYFAKPKLLAAWRKAKHRNDLEQAKGANVNPFGRANPSTKLKAELTEKNWDETKFAEIAGKSYQNIFNEIKGKRKISVDQAMKYSKVLGMDPVDLLFEKKHCHIWGRVDFLKNQFFNEEHKPGTIFQYYTDMNEAEVVDVPREIWRPDILAVKIISKASMYTNQVAFYYKQDFPSGINNNNRLVVTCNDIEIEDFDFKQSYFYLGIYEEHEGKINIKNPDPYAKDKYIVKDISPLFVAPVIALVRPGLIERDVIAKEKIRDHSFVLEKTLEQDKTIKAMKQIQETYKHTEKIKKDFQKQNDELRKLIDGINLYDDDRDYEIPKFIKEKFYDDRKKKAS